MGALFRTFVLVKARQLAFLRITLGSYSAMSRDTLILAQA